MKSILISIRPQWCEKIVSGKKTIEVRKTAPKEVPFKAYVYVTKDKPYLYGDMPIKEFYLDNEGYKGGECNGIKLCNGKVIGEFICDKIDKYPFHDGLIEFNSMGLPSRIYGSYLIFLDDYKSMCLSYDEVKDYGKGKTLYGWHISDLKIYNKPKDLSEFLKPCPAKKGVCLDCIAYNEYDEVCANNLTRPPQSWQYVEELGNE